MLERARQKISEAVKFSHPALSNGPALAHLGKAKLLELMTEDDASLIELTEGGTNDAGGSEIQPSCSFKCADIGTFAKKQIF